MRYLCRFLTKEHADEVIAALDRGFKVGYRRYDWTANGRAMDHDADKDAPDKDAPDDKARAAAAAAQ